MEAGFLLRGRRYAPAVRPQARRGGIINGGIVMCKSGVNAEIGGRLQQPGSAPVPVQLRASRL